MSLYTILNLTRRNWEKYHCHGGDDIISEKKSCQEFSEAIGNNSKLKY
jgi:hypothetical protein